MTRYNFKGQLGDETVICAFRKHWIQILPNIMALPVLLTVYILGLRFFPWLTGLGPLATTLVLAGLIFTTYQSHRQFMAIFQYYLSTVIITNYRVVEIDKSVFFRDSKDSIDLSKVQDVQKRQNGFFESILDFGTLTITLSGTHVSVNIDLVPRPDFQFKKIHAVKSRYMRERPGLEPRPSTFKVMSVEKELAL